MLAGVRTLLVLSLLTGAVYPCVTTVLAQVLFSDRANGSLVEVDGKRVGSKWIGQKFETAVYFHPRPSASDYDGAASGGSNLALSSPKLRASVQGRADHLVAENSAPPPPELLHASASGLDPHVSPDAARWQAARIAQARHVDVARVVRLVGEATEGRDLGILGEPRVNVLLLNLALDRQFGMPQSL